MTPWRHRLWPSAAVQQPGIFLLSLDTELAWGYYDLDAEREQLFSRDGARERASMGRVLELLEHHWIRATWALVGHLFFSRCEECEPCAVRAWRDSNPGFAAVHRSAHPLWYAPDVLDRLLAASPGHEIGCHGFSHRPFTDMDAAAARLELAEWQRLAGRFGLRAESMVFPRNRVAHLSVLREAGMRCFRAPSARTRWHLRRFGPGIKCADDLLALSTPRVYRPEALGMESGLVRIPASAWMFDFPRRFECLLDRAGLQRLRLDNIVRAIHHAAQTGAVVHLWLHPWEVRTEADVDKLSYVLSAAMQEIGRGRLRNPTMGELAAEVHAAAGTRRHAAPKGLAGLADRRR